MPKLKSLINISNENKLRHQTPISTQIPATASRKRTGQEMVHVLLKVCCISLQLPAIKKNYPNFL